MSFGNKSIVPRRTMHTGRILPRAYAAVFKWVYGPKPPPPPSRNAHLRKVSILSVIVLKQKYCTFFSSEAFCDAQKVTKRRLRTRLGGGGELTTLPRPTSRLGEGEGKTPNLISTPSTSRYRRLISLNPLLNVFFLHTAQDAITNATCTRCGGQWLK